MAGSEPALRESLGLLVRRLRRLARMALSQDERAFYMRGVDGALAWLAELDRDRPAAVSTPERVAS